jgi:hypothetical protein
VPEISAGEGNLISPGQTLGLVQLSESQLRLLMFFLTGYYVTGYPLSIKFVINHYILKHLLIAAGFVAVLFPNLL